MLKNWQKLQNKSLSWQSFQVKSDLMRLIRQFFWDRHFLEFDGPILNTAYPEEPNIYLTPATWQYKQKVFYLSPSPESSAKKLLAAGSGNCFTIAKCVRDLEDVGPTHNLEFNMLEFYEVGHNYKDVAQTIQQLFSYFLANLDSTLIAKLKQKINFDTWQETTVQELFQKYAQINLNDNLTTQAIIQTAKLKKYNTEGVTTWEPLFNQIWMNEIEPNLPKDRPVIVYDYPAQISTLCQPCPDARYGQRFEFYMQSLEFGNCYTELTDPEAQLKNFQVTQAEKSSLGQSTHPIDTDLIEALKHLPACSGIAIGIERLAMLFAQTENISEVVYFPTAEML